MINALLALAPLPALVVLKDKCCKEEFVKVLVPMDSTMIIQFAPNAHQDAQLARANQFVSVAQMDLQLTISYARPAVLMENI